MDPSADELLDLLGSDLNRCILALASEEDRSADAIAKRCDSSLPTVYRHIADLRSAGLLSERVAYDAAGNHFKVYRTAVDAVTVRLDEESIELSVAGDAAAEADAIPEAAGDAPTSENAEPPGTGPVENVERPGSGE